MHPSDPPSGASRRRPAGAAATCCAPHTCCPRASQRLPQARRPPALLELLCQPRQECATREAGGAAGPVDGDGVTSAASTPASRSVDHLRCLLCTVAHLPNRAGRSRQGPLVRCRKRMPLITLRWFSNDRLVPCSSASAAQSEPSSDPTGHPVLHQPERCDCRPGHTTHRTVPRTPHTC